ncbi:MAG: phosphoribosylglycinamide formyltransferase [Candidatus Micrarchaeia archaeon]|jgi:phosphoribosylglycinamide formyltransferase-1
MSKLKIAVLASGRGSNFKAIAEAVKKGEVDAEISILITDKQDAGAIQIAKSYNILVQFIDFTKYSNKEDGDLEIKKVLDSKGVGLVVLAGYMRILRSRALLDAYKFKIINIHPSLLPAFKGSTHAQNDAFDYGCKVSGLTIHFVTADVDGGQIIYQEAVDISDCKTGSEAAVKILKKEHEAYKKIIDSFSKGKYEIKGNRAEFVRN